MRQHFSQDNSVQIKEKKINMNNSKRKLKINLLKNSFNKYIFPKKMKDDFIIKTTKNSEKLSEKYIRLKSSEKPKNNLLNFFTKVNRYPDDDRKNKLLVYSKPIIDKIIKKNEERLKSILKEKAEEKKRCSITLKNKKNSTIMSQIRNKSTKLHLADIPDFYKFLNISGTLKGHFPKMNSLKTGNTKNNTLEDFLHIIYRVKRSRFLIKE